ncbi:adenosylmethionine decarboxylase [Candidatus Woesearchaeota archaeon]|nr:adenosylmethionine decarboxylase [Candidatus Woesearchaeota archaeon]
MKINTSKGTHLTIDGQNCDRDRLSDEAIIKEALIQFPIDIGMKRLSDPLIKSINEDEFNSGISGFILIYTSHVSIHTFPKRGYVAIDVFSCTNFDVLKAIKYFKALFQIQEIEWNVLSRGLNIR